jgi:hypothetical protein
MFALQDTREAQQMWERKFSNAGREGIVLSEGKTRGIFNLLRSAFSKGSSNVTDYRRGNKLVASKSSV